MAEGTAHAGQCYSTQAEAAVMLCSSMHGVSAGGALSCVGVAGASSSSGGGAAVTLTLRTLTSSGPVDGPLSVQLMPCETYGADYWAPWVSAWVLAAVGIVAARMVYERIFGTPTES